MSDSKWKDMAERTTILRCRVGSQAYGLSLEGGSDEDQLGVCIEDFEVFCSLSGEFEQYEYRTATERTGLKDAKSEAGDLDLKIYSLRKFLHLTAYGNPNVVELLFLTGDSVLRKDGRGSDLQRLYPYIISRQCGRRYMGYMDAQKQRLLGERGQMRITRTDLIEKFGYDVKYASHVIRLGYQGVELLETGRLTLPMVDKARDNTLAIKMGKWPLNEVMQLTGDLEQQIKYLIKDGPVRDTPDLEVVEDYMRRTYFQTWKARKGRYNEDMIINPESKVGGTAWTKI